MGKLLCDKNLRDAWCRNESVRAEIGQILHTHTHTRARARAAKSVVEIVMLTGLAHASDSSFNEVVHAREAHS